MSPNNIDYILDDNKKKKINKKEKDGIIHKRAESVEELQALIEESRRRYEV